MATGPQTPKSLKYARVISVFPLVKTLMVVSMNSRKDGNVKYASSSNSKIPPERIKEEYLEAEFFKTYY